METCKNCQNEFTRKYCNLCGEKIVEEQDFRLYHLLGQVIGAITQLDSKFFRTIKLLFFFLGKLSNQYIQGVRMPYMKPFQVFLLANIVFFIFLSEIDIFRSPSKWYFVENFDGFHVLTQVRNIMKTRNISQAEVALLYDQKSGDLAKGLIIILIPFIALIGLLLNIRKRYTFGKHLIFGMHYFSFLLLIAVIWTQFVTLFMKSNNRWHYIIPVTLLIIIYYIVASKHFYKDNWWTSIIKGIIGVVFINIFIQFYRVSISILSLNLL